MHSIARTIAFSAILAATGHGQLNGPTADELSVFETFALRPTSRIVSSRYLATVRGPQASAVVTAISIQDGVRQMDGVRIALTSDGADDRIFVAQEFVRPLIEAIAEIEDRGPQFLKRRSGNSACFGSGRFLSAMRQGAHFFHPSLCEWSDGAAGLSLSTGAMTFRFPTGALGAFRAALEKR